ncbi:MAG TPA: hypothetical protein PKM97_06340 [Bacteroidia bacterium]|nr:hypothetical protein [Bacteroidia bacterium]
MKAENKAYKIDLLMASLIFILTLFLLLTSSCKHEPQILPNQDPNSENNGTGNANGNGNGNGNQASTCSPDSVYFQKSILPLIVSNCAKSGCHDAASHKDGIVLDSYANIMNHGEIRPGRPGNSELIEVITETDPDDIMPPPPAAPMSQADINLLTAWINQGAQNNDCTDGNCDTTNISFSGTVSPILQSKCVGCHNNSLQSGQVNLSGHANVLIYAQSGSLLGSIMHANGYFPMPKGGTQLSDCEISSVRTWIRNGALNN